MLSSPNLFRSAALSFIRPAASVTSVAFPALSTALRARRGFTSATSNLRPPTASDITNLKYLVSNVLVGDKDDLSHYNNDWLRTRTGHSNVVLRPKTTEEVSKAVKYCHDHFIPITVQSGNTGLVGGSVPVDKEVVLSLERLNKILSVNTADSIATCESGVILQNLMDELENYHLMPPYDIGSKAQCLIGGNVATNAGGLRLLRYGSLRGTILGLEVVMADGKVLDLMRALRKDNTGYDLKQLFIGSEGTLGVITKVAMLCYPIPRVSQAALLRVSSFNEIIRLLSVAKASLGESLSAFEYFDGQCVKCLQMNGFNDLLKNLPPGRRSEEQDYYALVEVNGNNARNIELKIHNFVEEAESRGGVPVEGMLSRDTKQERDLWKIRENIPVALNREGVLHKYDVSLPVSAMDDLVRHVRREFHRRGEIRRVVGYGHVGDGNLHLNVVSDPTMNYSTPIHKELDAEVYEYTKDMRGSIAGEHGLGTLKKDKIFYSKPVLAVEYMKEMKTLFDPRGILNPGKVLPHTIPPESELP